MMASSREFLTDPKQRMAKWKGRGQSLMKQAWELSTLCDTPVCIVITPPVGCTDQPSRFGVWPNEMDDGASLRRMIDLYNANKVDDKQPNGSSSAAATVNVVKPRGKKKKTKIDVTQTETYSHGVHSCLGLPLVPIPNNVEQQGGSWSAADTDDTHMEQIGHSRC